MKKYRIKQVIDIDGTHRYYIEKRFLLFFWKNVLEGRELDCYWTYEDAKKMLFILPKYPRVDYFYPDPQ